MNLIPLFVLLRYFRNYENVERNPLGLPIAIIFCLCLVFIALFLAFRKSIKEYIISKKAFSKDKSFNPKFIHSLVENYHLKVNHAWHNFDFTEVMPYLSNDIKLEWLGTIDMCIKNDIRYFCSKPKIEEVFIVKVDDQIDDNDDKVVVKISAKMIRYKYQLNKPIKNDDRGFYLFTDKYYLRKNGNTWMIDKVDFSFMGLLTERFNMLD